MTRSYLLFVRTFVLVAVAGLIVVGFMFLHVPFSHPWFVAAVAVCVCVDMLSKRILSGIVFEDNAAKSNEDIHCRVSDQVHD